MRRHHIRQRVVIGGWVALVGAVAMTLVGSTFGLLSASETQGANSLAGATWSPSTAPTPTATNQTPGSNSVLVTWNAVTLSDTSGDGTIEYTVVRVPGNLVVCQLISATTCTDSTGTGGDPYTYTEEAFYVVNSTSTWSLGPSGASNQITFPETPSFTTTLNTPTSTAVGNSWSDYATVSGPNPNTNNDPAPTGSVAFTFCQEATVGTPCTNTMNDQGSVATVATVQSSAGSPGYTASGDVATYTPSDTETPTVGSYCYNASYTGTTNGDYSTVSQQTDTECFTVTPAAPASFVTNLSQPTSTTIGNSWNDDAVVTGNATGGYPTGSVAFTFCQEATVGTPCTSTTNDQGSVTTAGTVQSSAGSPGYTASGDVATYTLPGNDQETPTVGTYCYDASYTATSGGNYTSASPQTDTECFAVTAATPTFTTTISAPTSATVGNSWNDTATVTGNTTGGAPTGSVAFTFCTESSPPTTCTGGSTVATIQSSAGSPGYTTNGDAATFTLPSGDAETPEAAGTYCYNASYSATSGGNYTSVSSESNTECFTVTATLQTSNCQTPATYTLNPYTTVSYIVEGAGGSNGSGNGGGGAGAAGASVTGTIDNTNSTPETLTFNLGCGATNASGNGAGQQQGGKDANGGNGGNGTGTGGGGGGGGGDSAIEIGSTTLTEAGGGGGGGGATGSTNGQAGSSTYLTASATSPQMSGGTGGNNNGGNTGGGGGGGGGAVTTSTGGTGGTTGPPATGGGAGGNGNSYYPSGGTVTPVTGVNVTMSTPVAGNNSDGNGFAAVGVSQGLVQAEGNSQTSGTSLTITPTSTTSAGDLLVVSAYTTGGGTITVTDNSGSNSYTVSSKMVTGTTFAALAYVAHAAAASNIVVHTTTSVVVASFAEFAGYATVDKSNSAVGTTNGTPSSGTIATAFTTDLLVGAVGWSPNATFTQTSTPASMAVANSEASGSAATEQLAYEPVSTTGTYSYGGTFTSTTWGAFVYAFES